MKRLILMLQFLTKYPLPFQLKVTDEDFTKGAIYFPVVGGIIGLNLWLFAWLLNSYVQPLVLSVLLVSFQIFITGGLHLDGLADTFDGLYSYREKSKILEIMKDSRVGTNGVLVLIVSILLKVSLISSLAYKDLLWVLILMPVVSRYLGMLLAFSSVYARERGMGGFFINKISKVQFTVMTILTLIFFILKVKAFIILLLLFIFTFIFRAHVYSKIDGVTGDIIGCWIEMTEVIFLMVVVLI
ncbi:MAG: adenosylcobinamide-GDP ribazoletransferase [Clostridia bacterium]|nr:adenosylcobinamide-GDP ribazoletransferase [Clostridia bacterium]